ncbi:flagellar biosynthetic protein FliR [Caldithrix abyssi]|nr:flagellar biosynthetic protein FliR [Caldithrix abyssi]
MFTLADHLNILVPGYMLVFARLAAMVTTLPIFSYPMITGRIRILLAFSLTLIIGPLVGAGGFSVPENIWLLGGGIIKEIIIGMIIGYGARLIFEGIAIAGSVIGLQMGIAMANVMDPTSRQQTPIISQFWMLVMILFFLAADGHHFFIEILFHNFNMVPLGNGHLSASVGDSILRGAAMTFEIGIRFAAPAMAFLLLVDTAIGFIARVMPQLNVFFVSLPLKIGMGFLVLMVSLNIFQVMFGSIYDELVLYVTTLVSQLGGI